MICRLVAKTNKLRLPLDRARRKKRLLYLAKRTEEAGIGWREDCRYRHSVPICRFTYEHPRLLPQLWQR